MKYVLLVSHGNLATGMHSAIEMMTGDRNDILSLCLTKEMDLCDFEMQMKAIISKLHIKDELIVLADILSGSPFTTTLKIVEYYGFIKQSVFISGMNMPLVLSAVLMKDNVPLNDIPNLILPEGISGIVQFEINENLDEYDEL